MIPECPFSREKGHKEAPLRREWGRERRGTTPPFAAAAAEPGTRAHVKEGRACRPSPHTRLSPAPAPGIKCSFRHGALRARSKCRDRSEPAYKRCRGGNGFNKGQASEGGARETHKTCQNQSTSALMSGLHSLPSGDQSESKRFCSNRGRAGDGAPAITARCDGGYPSEPEPCPAHSPPPILREIFLAMVLISRQKE